MESLRGAFKNRFFSPNFVIASKQYDLWLLLQNFFGVSYRQVEVEKVLVLLVIWLFGEGTSSFWIAERQFIK